jgi:hypothetical protein
MPQTSQTPPPNNETNILGTFAGLLSLLGAALYFTGWIYRWAYFSFFRLEVTTLDLPFESFLMVPIQVVLGSFWALGKTVFAVVAVFILIRLTLWLIQWLSKNKWLNKKVAINLDAQKPLLNETVIVAWILTALFQLARGQGIVDARRDAFNKSSTLPVITLVTPEDRLALGRKPNKSVDNPSGFRIIGDRGRYQDLLARESNNLDNSRVWRLLIARNSNLYIFKTLSPTATREQRPPVIVIREGDGGDQLLILSPEATKPQSD